MPASLVEAMEAWNPLLCFKRLPPATSLLFYSKPIYLFEATVRTWLVHTPRVLSKRFPSFNRTISLLFMYMMFQVLAILGAFLLNAICSVTLDISGLAAKHAFDFSVNRSIAHGFATFYVTYSTIRVFVRFGQAIGVIAWESLDDFPDARKIVTHATSQWPMFIFIVFVPQCATALSLVGTPWLCSGITAPVNLGGPLSPGAGLSQAFPFHLKWTSFMAAAGEDGLAGRMQSFMCTRTPLLYLTRAYPNPRRTMSAVLVVGLVQYVQILLHRFPSWRSDMRASSKSGRLCVHFSLLACLTLTGRWLVGWMFLQLGLDLAGQVLEEWVRDLGFFGEFLLGAWRLTFKGMDDIQEAGLYIIMAWTLWVLMVAYVLCSNAVSAVPKDRELRSFFQNLKTSFIVAVTFFFLRGCASPTMGFIQAQQELTILTIVIPILYVALYTTVNAALQMSVGLVLVGGPVAMAVAVKLCQSSGFGGPGTFVVVFLHMFIKLLQLFGDDDFTNPERDGYDEDDARGRASAPGTPRLRSSLPPHWAAAAAAAGASAGVARGPEAAGGGAGDDEDGSDDDGDEDGDVGVSSAGAEKKGGEAAEGEEGERGGERGEGGEGGHGGGGSRGTETTGKTVLDEEQQHASAASGKRGRGISAFESCGGDSDSGSSLPSTLLPQPSQQLPRQQQAGAGPGTRDSDGVDSRKSRASSASPSAISGLARRHFETIDGLLRRSRPPAGELGAARTERGGGGGGGGDGGDHGVEGDGKAVGQQLEQGQPTRPSNFRGWTSERPFTSGSTPIASSSSAGFSPGIEGERGKDLLSWASAAVAGWDDESGYAGAQGVAGRERRENRRSLSVDDLQSLSSLSRSRNEEWAHWGRRNTGVPDAATSTHSNAIGNGNAIARRRGDGAGPGARAGGTAGAGGEARNDGASDDTAKRSDGSGDGGNGPGEEGPENRDRDLSSMRPAWMRSGVASGVASSLAAAMETNAQFVFKGTMRGGCALLAILSLFLSSCQIISMLQEQHEWYPSLIKYSVTDSKQLVVDNAFVVKATLETTGEPVIVPPRYASCESKWHGLSLLDYALLAELAYFDQHDDKVPLSEVAKQFFPPDKNGPDFKIKVKQGDDLHSHAQFFEAYSAKLNVSVVAIRGTDVGRISDLIEDIKIWVEPIVLKGLSMVFPTIRIWPDSTSSVVIEWLHETLQLFGLQQQAHYYRPLLEHVRAIKGRDVVLTGHSLGGGLARIVGALERAASICFSPPGIAQSYRKFSVGAGALDRALLHQMSVSVIPEYDFVPMIDTQVGLIQLISCDTAGKALQLSCHMLEGTICDIIRHCGDDRGRFTSCKFEYNMSHLVPQMILLLQGRWVWIGALLLLMGFAGALLFVSEFVTYSKSSLPLLDETAKKIAP